LHAGFHSADGRVPDPQAAGRCKVFFIGNALVDLFLQSLNWPFGSACAVALVAIMVGTISLYLRITRAQASATSP